MMVFNVCDAESFADIHMWLDEVCSVWQALQI